MHPCRCIIIILSFIIIGKRSPTDSVRVKDNAPLETSKINVIKHHDPVPFSIREHGHRFRRNINKCGLDDVQHVLFVLDTSGSIGSANFKKMIDVIASLTTLFCEKIKLAVLSYDHEFYLEFCFNCFGPNDILEQLETIRNIPYRGGGTSTGAAAKCVCDELLKPCILWR